MKTIPIMIGVAALSIASGALAQTAPAQDPQSKADVAAATLPGAFNAPVGSSAVPAAVVPDAQPAAAADARTETALRAVIASVQAGPLDPALFTAGVAAQMPQQEPPLRALLDGKGELVTIVHRGQRNGADIYQALFENGDTQWVIGLDEAGKVAVFLFRETPEQPGA
ncbi:MAG: hypothetical protein V4707_02920 [Pseudomonadota bacterium]